MASITICSVEHCGKPALHRGFCSPHYQRNLRHGSPTGGRVRRDASRSNHCGRKQCRAAMRVWGHFDYLAKKDVYKAKAKAWEAKPENWAKKLAYFERTRDASRARTREWARANPERKRQMDAEFKAKNPALVTSYKAARRARERQATPPWLTAEHWAAIRAVYAEARRKSEETGVEHEVDHEVPLQGRHVCGLHVPWNLRVLSRDDNNRRPRIWAA